MKTYNELLTERDALAAQVEMLRNAWESVKATDWNKPLDEAFDATPQQCLAEIRAEAVESAIKYCNLYLAFPVTKGDVAEEVLAISEIKMYAAKVRKGGE